MGFWLLVDGVDEGKQDLGKITAERWNSKQNALNLRAEAIHESFIVDDRSPGTPVGLLCIYAHFTVHIWTLYCVVTLTSLCSYAHFTVHICSLCCTHMLIPLQLHLTLTRTICSFHRSCIGS